MHAHPLGGVCSQLSELYILLLNSQISSYTIPYYFDYVLIQFFFFFFFFY